MATQTIKTHNRSPLTQALKACYPALGTTFVLSMFINAAMLASPLYSMQVYDRVLTSRNVSTLVMLTLIVGVFLILYGILEFTRSGVLARAGVRFESALRRPLFETMMKAELSPRLSRSSVSGSVLSHFGPPSTVLKACSRRYRLEKHPPPCPRRKATSRLPMR